MKNNKFSIFMPTYNDCTTIEETLDCIKNQTYTNWELIIINDGSTDDTENVVKNYIKNNKLEDKIKYVFQQNADQLNAIKNGLNYATGDITYIFHSDDLLADENVLNDINILFNQNAGIDGVISNKLLKINKQSQVISTIHYKSYTNKKKDLPLQLLNIGSQLYFDFPFLKIEVFKRQNFFNYLTWNRPFWCNIEDESVLNLKLVKKAYLKYRIYDDNYLASPMGMINVFNGEFRTAMDLAEKYTIPFYKFQYFCYRVFKKLGIPNLFYFIYKKTPTKNIYKLVKYLINNRFKKEEIAKFKSLQGFLEFYKFNNDREIDVTKFDLSKEVYFGCDNRIFNKKMVENKLSDFYNFMLDETLRGFKNIVVKKSQVEDLKNILHFLNLKFVDFKIVK